MLPLKHFVILASLATISLNLSLHSQEEEKIRGDNIPKLPEKEVAGNKDSTKNENEQTNKIVYNSDDYDHDSFFDAKVRGLPRFLNALDLSGYLRLRLNYFHNAHLKTYIPSLKRGTSNFLPNSSFIDGLFSKSSKEKNPSQNNFSGNMRLRINPTINISQTTRVKTTLDIFDNLVLGSTPSYRANMGNTSRDISMMSRSQNPPASAINLKRAWAESDFPIGTLKFGRMPMHWGLGILYNSGDEITSDYGDQIDGISFATKIGKHFIIPSYSFAYTSPLNQKGNALQSYPTENASTAHVFMLAFLKKDGKMQANERLQQGYPVFNYGLLGSYRWQTYDTQNQFANKKDQKIIKRNGHVGIGSIWTSFSYKTFHIEAEFAGMWGKYEFGGKKELIKNNGEAFKKRDVTLLQGGYAIESRYGFIENRLQLGFNTGLASWQNRLALISDEKSRKHHNDGVKSDFKFNPAYNIDLLLHREVLGTINQTMYFKPHFSYFFSRNLGLRTDTILTIAPDKSVTSGNSNWLGLELDGSAFIRNDEGMYFQLAYGILFPFKGLSHNRSTLSESDFNTFGTAKTAHTLQAFFGLVF